MSSSNQEPTERKLEYCGGFSMLKPDERKRNHIAAIALKEEQNYKAYRMAHKPHYNFVGRVDGRPLNDNLEGLRDHTCTAGAANPPRLMDGQSHVNPLLQASKRNTLYKNSLRALEEKELLAKKATARQQSEHNSTAELRRKERLDRERLSVNDAFLSKFEQKK